MRYKILKDGEVINTIIADEDFCRAYCEENGYTCEAQGGADHAPDVEPEPTAEEILDVMLGVKNV